LNPISASNCDRRGEVDARMIGGMLEALMELAFGVS
jgi:hypothetical protein